SEGGRERVWHTSLEEIVVHLDSDRHSKGKRDRIYAGFSGFCKRAVTHRCNVAERLETYTETFDCHQHDTDPLVITEIRQVSKASISQALVLAPDSLDEIAFRPSARVCLGGSIDRSCCAQKTAHPCRNPVGLDLKTASSSSKASLSVHPAYTFGFAHDHAPFVSSTSSLPSRSLCSDVHGSLAETSIRPHPCQRHRLAPQSSQTDSRSTAHLCRRARTRTLFRSSDLTLNFDGSLANRACNSNTTDHTCSELPDFTIGRLKTKTSFASGLHVLGLA
ncbi:hypothetical protein E5Q_00729, partial [Mixia osmundae IAM 14324]